MRSFRHKAAVAATSIFLMAGVTGLSAGAQDASPEASPAAECVVTTPEENVALVESLIIALEEGDAETVDAVLADDVGYNTDRYGLEHDHESNDDEVNLALMQEVLYPGSETVIRETVAADNKVVADMLQTVDAHMLTGELTELEETIEIEQIFIFTIECGEIVYMHGVVDELHLLTSLGVLPPLGMEEATPAP